MGVGWARKRLTGCCGFLFFLWLLSQVADNLVLKLVPYLKDTISVTIARRVRACSRIALRSCRL